MMTKLNFARPQLRYNDNLRRELSRNVTRSDAIEAHHRLLSNLAPHEPTTPKYLQAFSALSLHKQTVVNHLFGAWAAEMDALSAYLTSSVGKRSKEKKKAAYAAQEKLVLAGAIFVRETLEELANNESGVWEWVKSLRRGRDVHWQMSMADLSQLLIEESVPMYVEWALVNEPEFLTLADRLSARAA
jgi:hypothetical protein